MNNTDCFNALSLGDKNQIPVADLNGNVKFINMQDILSPIQEKWMFAIIITSFFLLIYVLYNSFVRNPRKFDVAEAYGVDPIIQPKRVFDRESIDSIMDELAIIPVVYLFIISITYYTGFKGV